MIVKSITLSILVLSMLWIGSRTAAAAISQNTIGGQAMLSASGRLMLARVQFACEEGEMVHVRVTVNQRSSGAVGEGETYGLCTGELIHLPLVLRSFGPAPFVAGEANGCALAMTFVGGQSTDAHQWCRAESIMLEEGGWPHMSPGRWGMPFSGRGRMGPHGR